MMLKFMVYPLLLFPICVIVFPVLCMQLMANQFGHVEEHVYTPEETLEEIKNNVNYNMCVDKCNKLKHTDIWKDMFYLLHQQKDKYYKDKFDASLKRILYYIDHSPDEDLNMKQDVQFIYDYIKSTKKNNYYTLPISLQTHKILIGSGSSCGNKYKYTIKTF